MDVKRGLVSIRNPAKKGEAPKEFTFDGVYDWKLVYESNLYFLFNRFLLQFQSKKPPESVKVVVRCRPLNEKEIAAGHER